MFSNVDETFLPAGSSYGNESVEMTPSLINNASVDSKFFAKQLEAATSKIVTPDGDWLNLNKCGVSLFVPDGVVEKGEELFSIEVADDDWNRPLLQEGKSNLSLGLLTWIGIEIGSLDLDWVLNSFQFISKVNLTEDEH